MSWSVAKEIGIEYGSLSGTQGAPQLRYPVYAAQAKDGTYLIVDDVCAEKHVPFRLECRTIRVDAKGSVLFDSWNHGMEDAYGCLADDGSIAVLRKTRWELLFVSPEGTVADCLDLTAFSKRMPRVVTATPRQTYLVVFLDRAGLLDIVEVDRQGRLLWHLPPSVKTLGVPSSVQLLSTDTLLVADAFHHAALELDRQGNVVWQFGEQGNPARVPDLLAGPNGVRALPDGRRLIADTRNHRILSVEADGTSREIQLGDGALTDPTYADATHDGHLLVCDSGNARVIELDRHDQILREFGAPQRSRRWLSFPRSVEVTGDGEYLIADTAHDRIVKTVGGQIQEVNCSDDVNLFWPRCVRALPAGSLIADGRHGRIIEVSQDGRIINSLSEVKLDETTPLDDPHDVRLLPNGHLLVTDSPLDAVIEVDWEGNVYRAIGRCGTVELDDPHAAQQLEDGTFVICDTGNHRIVLVDQRGDRVSCVETIEGDGFVLKMNRPRYLEVIPDGTMVIVDTGQSRVLATTLTGHLLWEISDLPDSPIRGLYQPRWATLLSRDEVVICDHFHHRIVHLRRD